MHLFQHHPHTVFIGAVIAVLAFSPAAQSQTLPTTLQQGMPYATARAILLEASWQAQFFPPNRERFGAMDYLIGLGYNEVTSCSGSGMGYCAFEFVDAEGNKLSVSTANNQPGQEPTLFRWWLQE